jgi:transcriptional antiterminator NusG
MSIYWYIVQTASKKENATKKALESMMLSHEQGQHIKSVLVPQEKVRSLKNGKAVEEMKTLYPGYIFIQMEYNENIWHLLRSIPGVLKTMTKGQKLQKVNDSEIQQIMLKMQESNEKPKHRVEYNVGEVVILKSAAFMGFSGEIVDVNYLQQKLKVNVAIFGRPTSMEVEFSQVEKSV